MADQTLRDYGIEVPSNARGNVKVNCPQCEPHRKHKNRKPLWVDVDQGVWICFHCDWRGSLKGGTSTNANPEWWREIEKPPKTYVRPKPTPRPKDNEANAQRRVWAEYMEERGIPADVMRANEVDIRKRWMPQTEQEEWVLAYPYYLDDELINVKYRSAEKHFSMERKAERILWRIDKVASPDVDTVIITEGENDALALQAAGFLNAFSVPDGAPDLRKDGTMPSVEGKMRFLENERTVDILNGKKRIILATDGDQPGRVMREELARRLGPDRCFMVQWPEGCKDANDVLVRLGPDALKRTINGTVPIPIDGVMSLHDFRDSMDDIYQFGFPPGPTTGWHNLDPLFRPARGLVTVVTGVPETGKSRFANALAVNQARLHGTKVGICSPEYRPTELLTKHLAETYIGKTMDPGAENRMSEAEYNAAMDWVGEYFHFIEPETRTIEEILDRAKQVVARYGIRYLIIDPWTEVEMVEKPGQNLATALQDALNEVQRFRKLYDLHICIVAHPTAQRAVEGSDEYKVLDAYDIYGGSHWNNKSDFVVSLWRSNNPAQRDTAEVDVHIQKARFQHLGKRGKATLRFDMVTGRYTPVQGGRHEGPTSFEEWM